MRKILLVAIIMLFCIVAKSQVLSPVHWSYAAKKTGKNEAFLFIKATIDDGWHIYSQTVKDGGPVKTSFSFSPSTDFMLEGKTVEPKPMERFEKVFNMTVGFFEHSVIFQQKIKLKKGQITVKGSLEYMTCNDQKCLPPDDVDFNIPVN